jgi:cytidylate kinase
MLTTPSLERAEAYLSLNLRNPDHGWSYRAAGPYVTISREAGAGGKSFAEALRQRLDEEDRTADGIPWTVFDSNLVEEMLRSQHLSPHLSKFLPEDRVSEVDSSVRELLGLHPNLWDLVQKTTTLARHLARAGKAIIVGRGGSFAATGIDNGVHVRLIASPHHRVRELVRRFGLKEDEAIALMQRQDTARQRYVRAVFNVDVSEPTAYHLVINTELVPLAEATALVAQMVQARSPVPIA